MLPYDSDGDGRDDCSYTRVSATWPFGFGGNAFHLVAVTGCPGIPGSIRVSNVTTLHTLDDLPVDWGTFDDGTFESGWVVQFPSGSSDFFSVNFDECPGVRVNGLAVAAFDFGTLSTMFPRAGKAPADLVTDPSGNTPDLSNPYADVPCPFPPLTFATTSGQMVCCPFATFTPSSGNVHGFIQFPTGDSGLLGIGADTSSTPTNTAFWTLDAYTTPANPFSVGNWGLRCKLR